MKNDNDEPMLEDPSIVWEEFLRAIWNSKFLVFFVFGATLLGAYGTLQMRAEVYETEARVLVKLGRENVEVPATVEKGGFVSTGVRKEEINSYVLLLSSRALLEQTLDTIGLEVFRSTPPPPETFFQRVKFRAREVATSSKAKLEELLITMNLTERLTEREKVLKGLAKSLDVDRQRDSDVISVRLRLPNPDLAVEFVETLLELYISRHIEVQSDPANTGFFEFEAADHKRQLAAIERTRSALRREFELTSIPDERNLILGRLHQLYEEIADDERERALLSRDVTGVPPLADAGVKSNLTIPMMKDRVTLLRINRVTLAEKYQPESRVILESDRKIVTLESMLVRALTSRIEASRSQAVALEDRLARLGEGEDRLESIERDRVLAEQNYMSYAKRMEEARISEELDDRRVANIAILAPPSVPIEPVAPRKLLVMALSVPTGLFLGFSLALLLDYLSRRVNQARDLDGIPYLETFRLGS